MYLCSSVHVYMCVSYTLGAIQRYFQSRQRIWREENQDADRISKQARNRKLQSRNVRVCRFHIYAFDDHANASVLF